MPSLKGGRNDPALFGMVLIKDIPRASNDS